MLLNFLAYLLHGACSVHAVLKALYAYMYVLCNYSVHLSNEIWQAENTKHGAEHLDKTAYFVLARLVCKLSSIPSSPQQILTNE